MKDVSRRDFLKLIGSFVGGLAVIPLSKIFNSFSSKIKPKKAK